MNEADLDREVADALRAEVAGVQPAPGAWERLAGRAAEPAPVRRRRWPALAAAAAVVLAVAGAAVAAGQGGEDEPPTPAADEPAQRQTTTSLEPAEDCLEILERGGTVEECQQPPRTIPRPPPTPPEQPEVVLEGDGFQGVEFGDPAEDVVAALTRLFGPPTEDLSQDPRNSLFGVCPGTTVRVVRWEGLFPLAVLFTDERGSLAFSGWSVGSAEPPQEPSHGGGFHPGRTATGIGPESSVAALRAAYPGIEVTDQPPESDFTIDLPDGRIVGFTTGTTDGDVVQLLLNSPCGE